MAQGIRHYHFEHKGFEGDWLQRTKDNIRVDTYEDEDCLDRFFAYVDGEKWGWVKNTDDLERLMQEAGRND